MLVAVVGVNHRTAPVEVREKLSFSPKALPGYLKELNSIKGIYACVVISTCNRTEIYISPSELNDGLRAVWGFLSGYSGLDIAEIKNYTFTHTIYDAARHLFRVASGLDSMILGETQILGQVKNAYNNALKAGTTNSVLNTMFKQAIEVGKKVRSKTGIDRNAISISYAAVKLAIEKFGKLDGRSVLIIGAGKMSELTVKHLMSNGVSGVIVSNRSHDRAKLLADKFDGRAVRFDEMMNYIKETDIVISSTAATHYVIRCKNIREIMELALGKKLMFIDIAVPRDVDPDVADIPGVTLYDIDDLQQVIDNNLEERRKAAILAEEIIEEQLNDFTNWLAFRYVVPTITALKSMSNQIKDRELEKALNRLKNITEREQEIIISMANSIVKKILHSPIMCLKEYALTTEGHIYTEALQNLFNLEVKGKESESKLKKVLQKVDFSHLYDDGVHLRSSGYCMPFQRYVAAMQNKSNSKIGTEGE